MDLLTRAQGRLIVTDYKKVEERKTVLAIICADERYPFFEDVVKRDVVGHNCVTIRKFAGGIAPFIEEMSRSAMIKDTMTLAPLNDWTRIVVVGHKNCGYYEDTYNKLTADQLIIQNIDHLRYTKSLFEVYDFLTGIKKYEAYFGFPTKNGYNFQEIVT